MSEDEPALTCAEAEALLPLVADGSIGADGDAPLFAHLARCERCQASLARHDLISLALAEAPPVAARRLRIVHYRVPTPIAVASAAAALLALGIWWLAHDERAATPAVAAVPEREIIRIEQANGPAYLIREGDRVRLVTPDGVDGAHRPRATPAQPVSFGDR